MKDKIRKFDKIFNCQKCNKTLWIKYYKLPDGKIVCKNCYEKFVNEKREEEELILAEKKQQLYYTLKSKNLHDMLYNFMKKYHTDIYEKLPQLIKLLKSKYNTTIDDKEVFIHVLWVIKRENDEKKELDEFEKELTNKFKKKFIENYYCSKCGCNIDVKTYYYSKDYFGKSLCKKDQGTKYQRALFSALKKRGVNCEYEAFDGHKHVDMAIHDAQLYIEIDGRHHSTEPEQLFTDIMRDKYSSKNGYITKRFSNKILNDELDEIADALTDVVKKIKKR